MKSRLSNFTVLYQLSLCTQREAIADHLAEILLELGFARKLQVTNKLQIF